MLSGHDKAALAGLLDGTGGRGLFTATINVTADAVICRAGDVDIAAFACELRFGATTISLDGRRANELFATMNEAGVSPEGAAGTIYMRAFMR